jgi:hypothetical protein
MDHAGTHSPAANDTVIPPALGLGVVGVILHVGFNYEEFRKNTRDQIENP